MKSPWGQRGAILAQFGWTYDNLLWGISWRNVCLMMADAPGYEYEDEENVYIDDERQLDAALKQIGW